jgi:hypothetical protein
MIDRAVGLIDPPKRNALKKDEGRVRGTLFTSEEIKSEIQDRKKGKKKVEKPTSENSQHQHEHEIYYFADCRGK